jgi:hypothetical protein
MKITTQRLKKLIREELEHLKESQKMSITPEQLDKLLKIASTGPEGYKQAKELALMFDGVDQDKIDAAGAQDFKTREQMFAMPYGKRPKAAIEYEIDKTIEDIKNAKTPREKHVLEDYLDGLEEELLEY